MGASFAVLKPALIGIILSFFNVDANFKMQLALLFTELMNETLWKTIFQYINIFKKKQITVPDATREYDFNPLFDRIQSYLTVKYVANIESCDLVPKNGDVEFDIKDMTGKDFIDKYTDDKGIIHTLRIKIENTSVTDLTNSQSSISRARRHIVIASDTANSADIKKYVKLVTTKRFDNNTLIKVYRPIIRGKKKDEQTVEWEVIMVKTNKNLTNTIYSEEVTKELFDDVSDFMTKEQWYADRGIPYKRGYFLHSTPGQGKTSVSKILAKMYGIPVFCLDLTIIDSNSTLVKLMTELNYYINHEKYILLMEDADRAEFFVERYRDRTVSMDCFLNVIDGVVEPHGRIIIMTANKPEDIIRHNSLMRPGRIDKTLEIKSCDSHQIEKMYEMFYCKEGSDENRIDWNLWKPKENLSAAYVMKLLQENITTPETFLRLAGSKCKKKIKVTEIPLTPTDEISNPDDLSETDEETKKKIAQAEEEQQRAAQNSEDETRFRRHRRRGFKRSGKIEDRVKNAKSALKRTEKRLQQAQTNIIKSQSKLPKLLEQLKAKQDRERISKLKAKGKRRTAHMKKVKESNQTDEYISLIADEPEYETPSFLLNSIPIDEIPKDTVTTYETLD